MVNRRQSMSIRQFYTYLVKDTHFQQALIVAPKRALSLAVSNTPSNLVGLEMPSPLASP